MLFLPEMVTVFLSVLWCLFCLGLKSLASKLLTKLMTNESVLCSLHRQEDACIGVHWQSDSQIDWDSEQL